MSDHPEFKHTSLLMSEGEQLSDEHQQKRWRDLQKECDRLKAAVECHERNAKLMEQSMTIFERRANRRHQEVKQLERRLEAIKESLGSLSYVMDYPDEEAAEIVEDLCRDAGRYRWLRKPSNTWDRHFDIDALDYWIVGSREETDNSTGEDLDKSVDFFMAKEKSGG